MENKKEYIKSLREAIRIFEREIFFQNNASCCSGISLAQCHSLLEIEKNNGISISELADNLSLDKSTISRTVDGLVNIGLVDRVVPKENRRKTILNLTENGEDVCSSINFANDSYVEDILKDFSTTEQQEFLRLFKKLTGNMATTRTKECAC